MANISIGRYAPYNSFLHRLDPRTKLFSMIFLMVVIFFNYGSIWTDLIIYGVLAIIIFIFMKVAHISFKQLFKQLKMMWFMIIFLFIVNIFTMKESIMIGGIDSFTIPYLNFTIYFSSFVNTFYIVFRLVLMVSLTLILTSSTKPMDLTYALEWMMYPLKFIKFPVHEVAMTISLALRFIPTLLDETERIMKAQTSRGVDFQEGKFKEKIRAVVSLIIPLFISSFQRSDELASAMEARGYNPVKKRTRYRILKWKMADFLSLLIILGIFGATLALSIMNFVII